MFIQYAKGKNYSKEINVGIKANVYAGVTTFIATTYSASKTFKTEKGADKWLTKAGYERLGIKHSTHLKIDETITRLRLVK
jgi:hypothetical protein